MTGKSPLISHEPIVLCDQCEHVFWPSDTCPPPSFAEQCRRFYAPSSRQHEEILREKSRLEGAADDYDRELTRLRNIVTQLESGRAQVQTHIDDYTSLASAPIRRLCNPLSQPNDLPSLSSLAQHNPDKILKRIFTFACYRGEDDAFDSHLQWLNPLVISHVCSHWRKVSLDMPEMWSYLDVTWDLNPKSNLELLHVYIARTKMDTPLSVRINSDMELFNLHYRAFSLVLEHAKRWREAIIIVDHQLLWQFLPDSFDILERLVLRILNVQHDQIVEYFKFVPKLRYVKINAAFCDLLSPFYVESPGLLGGADVEDVVCFESYQLDAPGLHLSLFPLFRGGSLQWTNLQALTLHSLSSDFEMLLDTITMPNLDRFSLVLDQDYKFDISLFLSLLSLVERSECKLSAFTLDMTYCRGEHVQSHIEKLEYENELREFLEAIPSITELRVVAPLSSGCQHCGHILPLVIEWLLVLCNDDPSMILPHLRNLEFVWAVLTTRNVIPLRTMVESRVEERVMFGGGEDGEASGDVSVGGVGDDISMGDTFSETSALSSEGDNDDPIVVSALQSLVIESRGEIDLDNFLWEWMKDVRTRGMVVYLR